ncbi:hypothetical protein K431DRAFT_295116 [Polychaeton citri CBS 116435]|uniref:Uncharacterized protein n=1 Tax=Polychaeton citri CBS 116435 TaxID=1314669 RepID=A0A9P4Q8R1_9PEZI|nr:hypothetical protein K431DRAFT_295116 [Polychaeton citri CBS 116435]
MAPPCRQQQQAVPYALLSLFPCLLPRRCAASEVNPSTHRLARVAVTSAGHQEAVPVCLPLHLEMWRANEMAKPVHFEWDYDRNITQFSASSSNAMNWKPPTTVAWFGLI